MPFDDLRLNQAHTDSHGMPRPETFDDAGPDVAAQGPVAARMPAKPGLRVQP